MPSPEDIKKSWEKVHALRQAKAAGQDVGTALKDAEAAHQQLCNEQVKQLQDAYMKQHLERLR